MRKMPPLKALASERRDAFDDNDKLLLRSGKSQQQTLNEVRSNCNTILRAGRGILVTTDANSAPAPFLLLCRWVDAAAAAAVAAAAAAVAAGVSDCEDEDEPKSPPPRTESTLLCGAGR